MTSKWRTSSTDVIVGTRLNLARQAKGLGASEVAAAVGVSMKTLRDFELGAEAMTLSTFIRFCEAVDARPEQILSDLTGRSTGKEKRK